MQNLGWEGMVSTTLRHPFPPVLPYTVMNNWFGGEKAAEEPGFCNRRQEEGEPGSEQAGGGTGTSKQSDKAGVGRAGEPGLLEQAG